MKKFLLSFAALLLLSGILVAQEDPGKAYKKAKSALGSYNLNPGDNEAKLEEARQMIETAITGEEEKKDARVWQTRGEIYNEKVAAETNMLLLNPEYKFSEKTVENAMTAVASFNKALALAEKSYQTKDALKSLSDIGRNLNSVGNSMLTPETYEKAYKPLNAVLEIHQQLEKEGAEGIFVTPEDVSNHTFVVAFCATMAGETEASKKLYKSLVDSDFQEPKVYSEYFKLLIAEGGKEEEALAVLDKGKKLFPNDQEIGYAEINYFLQEGRLDELTSKLQKAIDSDPENISLYSVLGNVYDNLFQREMENGNDAAADQHFDNAMKYYQQALTKKPDFFDAIYSIGALYYNKAAAKTKELIELEDDLSAAGIKKFNAKQEEVFSYFDQALPYFKQAEQIDHNDVNTLIALKEIYARKGELDVSNEFKSRLETVQNGGSNEKSYFNK